MTSEQAEGKPVDARSDIFSFGAVLYEMLTGQRAFPGDSWASTVAAVLKNEPRPTQSEADGVPRELQRIVTRCLRKDRERRSQSIAEIKLELEELVEESESGALEGGSPAAAVRRQPVRMVWAMMLAATVAAGGTWLALRGRQEGATPTYRLRQMTRGDGLSTTPALSPDGKLLAYASDRAGENNLDIWVQQVAGGDAIRLTRHRGDEMDPRFSPDGSQIVFNRPLDGIYVIPSLGGTERLIARNAFDADYSPDGKWIAYTVGYSGSRELFGLYIQPAAGGAAKKVETGLASFYYPLWSADSSYLMLLGSETSSYAMRGTDELFWYIVPATGGKAIRITGGEILRQAGISGTRPKAWLKDGTVLFSGAHGGANNVWRVFLESGAWAIRGGPHRVTAGSGEFPGAPSLDGRIPYSTGSVGTSIYSLGIDARQGKVNGELTLVVHDGARTRYPTLTRDGNTMVYISDRSGTADVWMKDLKSGAESPLVATPAMESRAIISPDGSQLAFVRAENAKQVAYLWPLPAGPERALCDKCGTMLNFSILNWSPDGTSVIMAEGDPQRFEALDPATSQRKVLVSHPKYPTHDGILAPDGHWFAFKLVTSVSVQPVFVTAVKDGAAPGENEWIKIGGDYSQAKPFWSPGGDLLYYYSTQDTFNCLYARRLDVATKRPQGEEFAVRHFHDDLRIPGGPLIGYGLAGDRLYLPLETRRSNIWLAEPEKQ